MRSVVPAARLERRERRLALAKRFYEGELPEEALIAYAEWPDEENQSGSGPSGE